MDAKSGLEAAPVTDGARHTVGTAASAAFEATFHELLAEPWAFEFFQAVRLLEARAPDRAPVGEFADPRAEVVRFRTATSMAFPASEIAALDAARGRGRPTGDDGELHGADGAAGDAPAGVHRVSGRARASRRSCHEGFPRHVRSPRAVAVLQRVGAWARGRARLRHRQLADAPSAGPRGIGTAVGLANRLPMARWRSLLFYAGLLGLPTRPAVALEQLVADYFGVPVRVEQFVGGWYPLEPRHAMRARETTPARRLSLGLVP